MQRESFIVQSVFSQKRHAFTDRHVADKILFQNTISDISCSIFECLSENYRNVFLQMVSIEGIVSFQFNDEDKLPTRVSYVSQLRIPQAVHKDIDGDL